MLLVAGSGALAFVLARRGTAAAEPLVVAHRALLGTRVEELAHGLRELEQWGATDRALDAVREEAAGLARAVRRSSRAVAAGTALTSAAAGLGVVAVAALVDPAATSPARLALLLLVPLALADAVGGLADAGALSVRARVRPASASTGSPSPPQRSATPPLPCPCPTATASWCTVPSWAGPTVPALALDHLVLRRGRAPRDHRPSGSGKSTLAATLVRFIDPVSGEVLLDGTDLRRLALDDVRRRVGLVDDDPHVFASTVAENVRLARPDADDDEVRAVLDRACLGPWVDGLPAGIHTHVGAGRREVSGGERARLALARSLLAGPAGARARRADRPPRRAHRAGRRGGDARLGGPGRTVDPVDHPRHGRAGRDGPGGAPRGGDGRLGQSACSLGERNGSVKVNVLP